MKTDRRGFLKFIAAMGLTALVPKWTLPKAFEEQYPLIRPPFYPSKYGALVVRPGAAMRAGDLVGIDRSGDLVPVSSGVVACLVSLGEGRFAPAGRAVVSLHG